MYHSMIVREQIIREKLLGKTLLKISEEQLVSYSTVRAIWQRYEKGGFENIKPRYQNCGLKKPRYYRIYRRSIWLRRHHPTWGAPYILTLIGEKYPKDSLPSIRMVQKWFKSENLGKPKVQREKQTITKVKEVHDCWQIDAKENIKLGDGTQACYLTTVDVKSGAVLETPVFSLRKN